MASHFNPPPCSQMASWGSCQRGAPSTVWGLEEFDANKSSEAASLASEAVANILSQLSEGSTLSKSQATKLVPTAPGLLALPKKLVERIVAGQYVDFTELPPAKGRTRALPSSEEGHIVVIRAEDLAGCRKLIPDLATWLQCFCIYAAVIAEHEPDRTKSLFAYASTIAKASSKYKWPSWLVYDQNFRQEAADSGSKDWARVDPSIYKQCFTSAALATEGWCKACQSVEHSSERCPLKTAKLVETDIAGLPAGSRKRHINQGSGGGGTHKRMAPHSVDQTCKKYNQFNGDCKFGETCIYQHRCEGCEKQGHPRSRCPEVKKS